MKKVIVYIFFISALTSCKKKIYADKGGLDVISNVYFDASKGLNQVQSFNLSRINYSNDTIIEIVPNLTMPQIMNEVYFITDSICYPLGTDNLNNVVFTKLSETKKKIALENKTDGTLFLNERTPNFVKRDELKDTILFKKTYKRFQIDSPTSFTRYYIYPTDTIVPYSLYKDAEKFYGGRLERIDSYNKKKDIFITLQIIPRKKWDNEAKRIFDFNHFLEKKNK